MIIQGATEAETMTARARDCGDYPTKVSLLDTAFYGILTIRRGTPFQFVLVINVCSCQEGLVSVSPVRLIPDSCFQADLPSFQFCRNKQVQRLRIHYPFAASGGALYSRGLAFIFDLLSKICPVTIDTVSVSAFHSICF